MVGASDTGRKVNQTSIYATLSLKTARLRCISVSATSRLTELFSDLSDYSKAICDNKYPCNDGGWLSYRVLTDDNLDDVLKILASKLNK